MKNKLIKLTMWLMALNGSAAIASAAGLAPEDAPGVSAFASGAAIFSTVAIVLVFALEAKRQRKPSRPASEPARQTERIFVVEDADGRTQVFERRASCLPG
jgi:membrane protein implicated in regulation of membrane protease activity